jgi:uroporphyrinogen decarboxylase
MTSKERVLTALNHEEPDKVPLDSWLAPEVSEKLRQSLNVDVSKDRFALNKILGHDVLYGNIGFCDGYNSIFHEERRIGNNLYQDRFGIKWRKKEHSCGAYCEFAGHPLADLKAWDTYRFPDPVQSSSKDLAVYRDLIKNDGKEYAILGGVACTMLEGAWYLRGLDNFLADLVERRDFVEALLDGCMGFSLALSKELVKMGADIIWWGDDVSIETGPMFAPALVRQLVVSRYARMVHEVKKINKDVKVAFHCDGKVEWLLDDLVEAGIDVINPLQPDANDAGAVKKRYGKRLSVWGNVDTRRVMSNGTAAEVMAEVRNVINTLGPGGGLLLCSNHTVQSTPRSFENTITYYFAAHHFRNYPLSQKKYSLR